MAEKIESVELRVDEAPQGVFMIAGALIVGATVAIAYLSERAYAKWWEANHPFAGAKARIERMRLNYRNGRADLTDVAGSIWEIFGEVTRALEQNGRARE